jgi:P-type Ca2+ transporter type 2C
VAATLEIEEAALTGESLPVAKSTDPVPGDDVPLSDRTCLAYMNTSVTRGRGEMVVTATGMETEIGHIANLLATTEADKTPLQKQLDGLSKIIATIAGIALVLVVILGLVRGQSFDTLFITGVALAVAAIRPGCRRWSRRCCRSAPARSPAATPSSSACRRSRRWARPR